MKKSKRKSRRRYNPRAGGEKRGNNKDRAARKRWMLTTFGTGKTVPCTHCELKLTYETVTADRVEPGGSYRRDNIVPACIKCNQKRHHGMASVKTIDEEREDYFKNNPRRRSRYKPVRRVKSKIRIYRRRSVA